LPACNKTYTPKPRDYPDIKFPEKAYQVYRPANCPYSFEYPDYAYIERDTFFFGKPTENPCWFNIKFPQFNATLYFSYKVIGAGYTMRSLSEDAYELTFKHAEKADYIEPKAIETPNHVYGLIYDVGGNAASSIQFFLSDTTKNFLRAALYFHEEPNADSLAPVVKFINQDIMHLIETLQWKN